MKNQLGDMPNMNLDDEVLEEDKLPEHMGDNIETEPVEELSEGPVDSFAKQDKMNKILTIVLIVAVSIAILILLGFGIKKLVDRYKANKLFDDNQKTTGQIGIESGPDSEDFGESDVILSEEPDMKYEGQSGKRLFMGVEVVGDLIIPSIKLNYPILYKMTDKNLEKSITLSHGTLNEPGVSFIEGHNYKNDKFFSNLYKVKVGDKITVKDEKGKRTYEYEVYDVLEVTDVDKSFLFRTTKGLPEITLSTCTDNVVHRDIVHARLTQRQIELNKANE